VTLASLFRSLHNQSVMTANVQEIVEQGKALPEGEREEFLS
jgi:hypothetical protein